MLSFYLHNFRDRLVLQQERIRHRLHIVSVVIVPAPKHTQRPLRVSSHARLRAHSSATGRALQSRQALPDRSLGDQALPQLRQLRFSRLSILPRFPLRDVLHSQELLHEHNIALEIGVDVALLCEEVVAAARLDFFDGLALEIAADPCCSLARSSQPNKARAHAHARHYAQHPGPASEDRCVLFYSLPAWPSVAVDITCGEHSSRQRVAQHQRNGANTQEAHNLTPARRHTPPHTYLGRP